MAPYTGPALLIFMNDSARRRVSAAPAPTADPRRARLRLLRAEP
ncbi:hypothetical protein ACFONC_08785 [Luteimonas soli]|uniref:Uncharacterized protein n=1 Tax=Luteimonas soli TaxID=1648966 RepID=A0ABV7XKI6_9GAMM